MTQDSNTETAAKRAAMKAAVKGVKIPPTPPAGCCYLAPEAGNYEVINTEEREALKKWAKKRP